MRWTKVFAEKSIFGINLDSAQVNMIVQNVYSWHLSGPALHEALAMMLIVHRCRKDYVQTITVSITDGQLVVSDVVSWLSLPLLQYVNLQECL